MNRSRRVQSAVSQNASSLEAVAEVRAGARAAGLGEPAVVFLFLTPHHREEGVRIAADEPADYPGRPLAVRAPGFACSTASKERLGEGCASPIAPEYVLLVCGAIRPGPRGGAASGQIPKPGRFIIAAARGCLFAARLDRDVQHGTVIPKFIGGEGRFSTDAQGKSLNKLPKDCVGSC